MERSRKLLIKQLRETIELLETEDIHASEFDFMLHRWWSPYYDEDVHKRLDRIESLLEQQLKSKAPRCVLSEEEEKGGFLQLITGLVGRFKEESQNIFSWLAGSKQLVICDPYFYSFDKPKKHFRTISSYMDFQKKLIPNGLEDLDVFHFEGPNRKIINGFSKYCRKNKIKLRNFATGAIHDRVLIKNNATAKVLGTSFGGLGHKIAFFVDLPQNDVQLFKKELHKIRNGV